MPKLWQRIIQGASHAVLQRQEMSLEARTGRAGEEAAYWHLRQRGFIMVDRNYRPEGMRGEIDLIGWDGDTLVFIEVKTRQSSAVRAPEAAVDREKEAHVIAAAREYRRRAHRAAAPYRFDVVSVEISPEGNKLEHFRDAFR
ncbi:MAG: YraN family protein [Acidobacteria bacterium]|nr:YraN family protein [Acidobacteriota bacterium]